MTYDKTVTLGNLLTAGAALVSVAVAWGAMTARMDASDQRIVAQRLELTTVIAEIKEGMKEQRTDQKELSRKLDSLATDTAFIRGRAADSSTRK